VTSSRRRGGIQVAHPHGRARAASFERGQREAPLRAHVGTQVDWAFAGVTFVGRARLT
jgi:hypothetical protein